jgi:hypothetical protein
MSDRSPSALVTDKGKWVLLRLQGRIYELRQEELRDLLGLAPGSAGVGITVDKDRFRFEFSPDDQVVQLSARQLHRRLKARVAK